jgi:two-component sensor histidine kinase
MNVAPKQEKWSIADVYITDELAKRAPKKADYLQEKLALQDLAARMADQPEEVLQRFVDLAMEMTGGVSAGLSLYEPNPTPGVFRWRYLRGVLAQFENATTPRNFSPCGITLDQGGPVLSLHPERVYDWISDANIVVPEVLLVPLYLGDKKPMGTLWIVAPTEGHFDGGHARVVTELAAFVAIAVRMLQTEQRLKDALDQQETLTKEMSHRVKNLFAITMGMVRISERASSTPAEMSQILSGRLTALAEANALVRRSFVENGKVESADLSELAGKILLPHTRDEGGDHFSANGPSTWLGERTTNGVALVLHELATNAAKYGALKSADGVVELSWTSDGQQLTVEWIERGGAAVDGEPSTSGFGTRLSKDTIVGQLGGTLNYDWQPAGLVVTMVLPVQNLAR